MEPPTAWRYGLLMCRSGYLPLLAAEYRLAARKAAHALHQPRCFYSTTLALPRNSPRFSRPDILTPSSVAAAHAGVSVGSRSSAAAGLGRFFGMSRRSHGGDRLIPHSSLGLAVQYARRLLVAWLPSSRLALNFRDHSNSSGGSGNNNNNNNNNNRSNNKNESSGSRREDDEDNADDSGPEEWLVPRTCLVVLAMFVSSAILWWLAQPGGQHSSWRSLNERAGAVNAIAVYSNYLQVYLDDAKVFLGLVNDSHTQAKLDALVVKYTAARKEAEANASKAKSSRKDNDDDDAASAKIKPEQLDVQVKGTPLAENALAVVGVVAWVAPFIFFPVFVMFLSQYIGKSMSYAVDATKGKTKAKQMIFKVERSSSTRFRNVAGMKEPKKEMTEIVDFLSHAERYTRLGAKIPTGALLLGPPGTGKTLLAKAVAGESSVGFIPVCGADFVELYVGMGALRIRQLFAEAKKQRCIVYIDEIDAIGLRRQGAGHGEKQEQEQTLNELLTQLDGFKTANRGDVMVLASSNVPQEALDPALIRPGRFDRIIHVDTPVIGERVDIFKVHLSGLQLTVPSTAAQETAAAAPAERAPGAATTAPFTAAADHAHDKRNDEGDSSGKTLADAQKVGTQEGEGGGTPAPAEALPAVPSVDVNTDEKRLVLSAAAVEKSGAESAGSTSDAFDFEALLMTKSAEERALIDVYATRMSGLCPGFVGADIANVCNEAAILAAREDADHVSISHLERSIDRVLAGIEHRSRAMSDFEKNVVAHHEAGHAVAGWFLNRADPLMKVSIVPRGGSALGYAQYLPNENVGRTAKEIKASIAVTLGGRIAEQIFFNHLSTGASDDLRKVGKMAYMYVAAFADGAVYPAPGTRSTRYVKPFGSAKSDMYDVMAKELVDGIYKDTHALLLQHKEDMERLAQHLLQHELLTYHDVVGYLGPRHPRVTDRKRGV